MSPHNSINVTSLSTITIFAALLIAFQHHLQCVHGFCFGLIVDHSFRQRHNHFPSSSSSSSSARHGLHRPKDTTCPRKLCRPFSSTVSLFGESSSSSGGDNNIKSITDAEAQIKRPDAETQIKLGDDAHPLCNGKELSRNGTEHPTRNGSSKAANGKTHPSSKIKRNENDTDDDNLHTTINGNDTSDDHFPTINDTTTPTDESQKKPSPTAPEVNRWTTVMADGTTAITQNPEKEYLETLYTDLTDMSPYDNAQVQTYWDRLMPKVSYLGTSNASKVLQALRVAYRAHRDQTRKSGEPFVIHPVEVAILLAELKMDAETVMSGLLHDTVEDTDLTFTQVEAMFGPVVRGIVEGETKVSKLPKLVFEDYADEQAENLRQMFVAMTDDYRIIIVKLADRLHNMRTLRYMKPAKQQKISRETLDIFAPLAHRMGIWQFKSELEDTAFMYLYPMEYKRLNRKLRRHQTKYRETLDKSQEILRRTLEGDMTLGEQAAEVKVYGRTKELYSLWHKMKTRAEFNLEQVTDVVALRVILYPKEEEGVVGQSQSDRGVWLCYHVLGLVQHLPGFQPVPTKVKDYISFPKPNGYQSLHTALMLNGQTIEVQIRTSAMHQVAEYGMASHWAYTDEKKRSMTHEELYNTPWLSSIKEWQKDFICSRDFVECVRRELLGKRVFVFLRNGKILNLARGATVIDAAFQIHTEVGLSMHGAEINGRPVSFSYELKNGDVVSILTGDGKPSTDWMRYAKSRSTRSKLRSYFRSKQRESLREAGNILLSDFLHVHEDLLREKSFSSIVPRSMEDVRKLLPGKTRFAELDELLIEIGKRHDRDFLRSVASKLFKVPLNALVEAELKRSTVLKQSLYKAVNENRKIAKNAAEAVNDFTVLEYNETRRERDEVATIFEDEEHSFSINDVLDDVLDDVDIGMQYADPDYLCQDCLPVKGDEILGTKTLSKEWSENDDEVPTTVHRLGCIHAERALNRSRATKNGSSLGDFFGTVNGDYPTNNNNDSQPATPKLSKKKITEHERARNRKRYSRYSTSSMSSKHELPVKLRWPPHFNDIDKATVSYLAEIVVVADDRKLLLADCCEVVSEKVDIVKTNATVTKEHATIVFLVKVRDLDHLQELMNALGEIRSVMSVERQFGSELH